VRAGPLHLQTVVLVVVVVVQAHVGRTAHGGRAAAGPPVVHDFAKKLQN
jgi:hypothetical protein